MSNQKELGKPFTTVLNKLCSAAIIEGLPTKIGNSGWLTLICGFGNSTIINAFADSGEGINLMPYSFYMKLGFPKMKSIRMTIYMANHLITHPFRIVEDLLVKVAN